MRRLTTVCELRISYKNNLLLKVKMIKNFSSYPLCLFLPAKIVERLRVCLKAGIETERKIK